MHDRKLQAFAAGLLVILIGGPVLAADRAERIESLLDRYHELQLLNGSVLVAAGGEVIFERGYGFAEVEWQVPNGPDTKHRLGSITKQFTATLVLQLVEDGTLSLDDRLADLLPWYRQDTGSRVTLHQLLNHTSGIPSYTTPAFFRDASRTERPTRQLVTELCSGDLEFEPGSEFRYNNSGYVILGAILEEVMGTTYGELLEQKIFSPLGMDDSGYDHTARIIPRRAEGYERTLGGLRHAGYLAMSLPHAAGALYSTVRDLHRWDRALAGDEILSGESKKRMFTPGLGDYGYGWGITTAPIGPDGADRRVMRHGGGINGFNTLIVRIPADGHLVVLLNNTGGTRLGEMYRGIVDVLYGRQPAAPEPPLAPVLYREIGTDGTEVALERLQRRVETGAVEADEAEINRLGYALLGEERIAAAVAVFRLNAELFPESWNVYDSLGEALAAAGQTDEAIRAYAQSLMLNPENRNAVEHLSRLTQP